jgi:hypothetical protein
MEQATELIVDAQNSRDYESEAKVQGWKPEQEFDGDPNRWVDAKTFVERGEAYIGYLKPVKDRLERELRKSQQLNKDLTDHHKRLTELQQKEIAQLEIQLQARRQKAVTDGDGQAFTKADNELEELRARKQTQPSTPAQKQDLTPTAQAWLDKNTWYLRDKKLRAVADAHADELRSLNPDMPEEEYFENIASFVKEYVPNQFKTNKGSDPGVETGGRRQGPTSGSQTKDAVYKNLPKDAKDTADRMFSAGMIKDKDLYARAYFAQEGV